MYVKKLQLRNGPESFLYGFEKFAVYAGRAAARAFTEFCPQTASGAQLK